MTKILFLKGLPASGKSTHAKGLVTGNPSQWLRINKDSLRLMLHDGEWSKTNEKIVMDLHFVAANRGLEKGMNVIIDDTNFSPRHEATYRALAEQHNAEFEIKFFDTPVEECIKRDRNRKDSVGKHVIMEMYNKFLKPEPAPPPAWGRSFPTCIIVDVDGTLAIMHDRGAYDWAKVGNDLPNRPVMNMVTSYKTANPDSKIIIFTGRDGSCERETKDWLKSYGIEYDDLYIREAGNMEKDSIIKRRMYDEHILGKYNVEFVVDDRDQVVDMWRNELGLPVFQVNYGDF